MGKKSHAIIKKINLENVIKSEGVVAVVTSKDIPGRNDVGAVYDGDPIFPTKKVEYFWSTIICCCGQINRACKKSSFKSEN